ncbi:unnamed protein product [Heligmosomoides polygyrus]|uniref:Uncharacterized protein n=1 Tax=Heligmosomoides polygyrus TaxID=6339 RepID=A0A183FTM2_HELPZ|nr:unnamed protein product [Heligmosomoides polygyrus]
MHCCLFGTSTASPGTVADVFGTSTARHAWLPTCSAHLRLAMHGYRRARHVYGIARHGCRVFGTSAPARELHQDHAALTRGLASTNKPPSDAITNPKYLNTEVRGSFNGAGLIFVSRHIPGPLDIKFESKFPQAIAPSLNLPLEFNLIF